MAPSLSLTSFATSRDVVGSMVEVSMNNLLLWVGALGKEEARISSKTALTCLGSGSAETM